MTSWYRASCECLWSDAHLIYPCEAHAPAFDSFEHGFPTAADILEILEAQDRNPIVEIRSGGNTFTDCRFEALDA